MQTTLRIEDSLYREAKSEAAREGVTLTRFLEEALRLRLEKAKEHKGVPSFHFRTYRPKGGFPFDESTLKAIANRDQELHDIQKIREGR